MEELVNDAKVALADTFAMYLKAHNYHWNVEGSDFPQLHELFEKIYGELWGAVDSIAEHIRTCDSYVPGSFSRFSELTKIEDELKIPAAPEMVRRLLADNDTVMASLKKAYESAETAGNIGFSNFLQDRYDAHMKHGWMLRATIKRSGAVAASAPKK
jgi:starvation-inducible DNA-binding protein